MAHENIQEQALKEIKIAFLEILKWIKKKKAPYLNPFVYINSVESPVSVCHLMSQPLFQIGNNENISHLGIFNKFNESL